jgi:hypothetical protein
MRGGSDVSGMGAIMRKCGFHVQATSPQLREAILRVKPTVIASLAHDRGFWQDVKRELPGVFLIGRRYEEGRDWRQTDPRWWAEQCARLEMPYDAFITWNEPTDIYNNITLEMAAWHDDWCCEFRNRIIELGYQAVALNVPTGHFHRNAVVNLFPNICQSFQYIGLHEYSARVMWDQDPKKQRPPEEVPRNEGELIGRWYCQRYRDWHDGIVARWPEREGKFQMVATECGVAYGVMPGWGDVGWRTDLSVDQYVASLRWYFEGMNRDDYCLGGAIFMMGFADHKWASFETLGIWQRLLEIPEAEAPGPPAPPPAGNGGDDMNGIKIYDFNHGPPDGATVDWQWIQDTFGDVQVKSAVDKFGLQPGDPYYKLVYLDARIGDANIIIGVRDEDGNPVEGAVTVFGWPDAPDHGLEGPIWTTNGVPGPTNAKGDVGPGLGPGAYYSPDEGERGPHFVWVHGLPSDYVDGLGMLGMTNHAHLNLGYRAVRTGEGGNGNGNGGEGMWTETGRSYDGSEPSRIILHLSGGDLYDTRGDMICGSWRLPEPVHPQEGDIFVFDTTYPEMEDRTYVAWIYRLPGGERVSDEVACDFGPGKRGTYHVRLTWAGEGPQPEPPGPEPPPDAESVGEFIAGVKAKVDQDVESARYGPDGWEFEFYG